MALMEDEFYMYKNKYFTYTVKLDTDFLSYTSNGHNSENNVELIESVSNISGCALMKSNRSKLQNEVFLKIHFYSLMGGNKKKRKRKIIIFEVSKSNSFEENLQIANKWRSFIYHVMYSNRGNSFSSVFKIKKKKLLIFINPKSGPGTAFEIFDKKVKPVLSEAEITYDLVITDHANHAYELVQHKELHLYAGLVIIAGDGLIYEIYNGLYQRSDKDAALAVPIGVIPGGSGNGFASSISHLINEPYLSNPVLVSTLNIVNPVASPLDLVLLQTHNGRNLISFLSIGLGILSDIDIESERLRAIGEARFTIYGLAKVFNLHKYRVRLSYKLSPNVLNTATRLSERPRLLHSQTVQEETTTSESREKKKIRDLSRPQSTSFEMETEYDVIDFPAENGLEKIPHKTMESEILDNGVKETQIAWDSSSLSHCEKNLNNSLSNDWVTIEDDFISIYAVNQPYIGSTAIISPKSTLNDGVLWLCFIKGNVSRSTVIRFLIGLDYGTHIDIPGITYIPVTDLRIVPLCPSGKLTVDGELIEFGELHATVLPGKGRVMVRRT